VATTAELPGRTGSDHGQRLMVNLVLDKVVHAAAPVANTSIHAWLEERGSDKMYLIALIDDATSRLFARFVPADSTEHHMRVLWRYTKLYGRPLATYTDQASLFRPTLAPGWKGEEPGRGMKPRLGGHSGNWVSNGSGHIRHRPRGESNAASGPCRIGW